MRQHMPWRRPLSADEPTELNTNGRLNGTVSGGVASSGATDNVAAGTSPKALAKEGWLHVEAKDTVDIARPRDDLEPRELRAR